MKFKYLPFCGLLFCQFLFSQILTVNSGYSVSIASGSSVTLDGLEIALLLIISLVALMMSRVLLLLSLQDPIVLFLVYIAQLLYSLDLQAR